MVYLLRLMEISPAKILLIEDTDFDQEVVTECLKANGFVDVTVVISGEDALKKLEKESFDAAIIDTNLPGIDGFKTCEKIKSMYPSVKVIIVTGNPRAVNFPEAQKVKSDGYTVKTADCADIIWNLRRSLAH
ncbi:MAG: response regulator [Candidatus Omnitrophica bacterium]|nr:response regulator [Candidatus Omnitrophota bacterium]